MHRSLLSQVLFPFFSLLLLSGCDGLDFREMPTEDPLAFEARMQDLVQQYWKPGAAVELPLTLASEAEAAREETFQVLSATLDDGTDVRAHVTHDEDTPLTLQAHTLHYTPQGPGAHTLRLRVGLPWEPEGAQETMCQVQVPQAPWRVRGQVNEAGTLGFQVSGVDGSWAQERWRVLPHPAWSEGVEGELHTMPAGGGDMVWEMENQATEIGYGINENVLMVHLTESTLDAPHMRFRVQGPDDEEKEVRVDLTPLCVANLREGMDNRERALADRLPRVRAHVQRSEELSVLEEAVVRDPNRNREKVRDVEALLGTLEVDKENYARELRRLETLDQQDPDHASRELPTFLRAQQHLEDAVKRLKSTQVQLQEQCTTPHEALVRTMPREEAQEATKILLEDPTLEVNEEVVNPEVMLDPVSLLMHAAMANNTRAVTRLLERGARVYRGDPNGGNPTELHRAAEHGNREIIDVLMNRGAHVHAIDLENYTPLHMAAFYGRTEAAARLLEHGAEINAENLDGNTPLHVAVIEGHLEAARALLEAEGVDVNLSNKSLCRRILQISNNHARDSLPRIRAFLARDLDLDVHGYDPNADAYTRIRLLVFLEGQLHESNTGRATPLHVACDSNHTAMVRALLEKEAIEADALNEQGASPLHIACHRGNVEVVNALLGKGVAVNIRTNGIWTALFNELYPSEIPIILQNLPDFPDQERDRYRSCLPYVGITPLHLAAYRGSAAIVTALLNNGAEVNQRRGGNWFSALHFAAFRGHTEVVNVLLERGADVNARQRGNPTALHLASSHGNLATVRTLLDHDADITRRTYSPERPPDIFRPGTYDSYSARTALDLALERNDEEGRAIARLLRVRGCTSGRRGDQCTIS